MSAPHTSSSAVAIPSEEQRRVAKGALFRRRATALLAAASLMLQQACYTSTPVVGVTPVPAGVVKININERGRLLVGARLGTLLTTVTGRIVRMDSANVEVAVETAENARGNIARWGGERFTIPRDGIETMVEKKVSKWKSLALVGGVVLGIVIFAVTINSSRFSGNDGGGPGPDPI